LLRGYTTQARQAFQELQKDAQFSTRPEDKGLIAFFRETARRMNSPEPVPAASIAAAQIVAPPEPFGLFLYAVKDWQLSDFPNAAALFEQFLQSQSVGVHAWINDYKPLAQKFLTDYRLYADWKKEAQAPSNAEQIEKALNSLRAAQGKLQLRGRLNDAFKDEEAKLVRLLDEQKKKRK
jgi:hypothetical protein